MKILSLLMALSMLAGTPAAVPVSPAPIQPQAPAIVEAASPFQIWGVNETADCLEAYLYGGMIATIDRAMLESYRDSDGVKIGCGHDDSIDEAGAEFCLSFSRQLLDMLAAEDWPTIAPVTPPATLQAARGANLTTKVSVNITFEHREDGKLVSAEQFPLAFEFAYLDSDGEAGLFEIREPGQYGEFMLRLKEAEVYAEFGIEMPYFDEPVATGAVS